MRVMGHTFKDVENGENGLVWMRWGPSDGIRFSSCTSFHCNRIIVFYLESQVQHSGAVIYLEVVFCLTPLPTILLVVLWLGRL